MRQKSGPAKEPAAKIVKDIRRATRRQFSAEEKIRIVLEGLRAGLITKRHVHRFHRGFDLVQAAPPYTGR
jgi:hypothetical protein